MNGAQQPTFSFFPPAPDQRTADDAVELARAAGIELLPWQEDQVRRVLGQREREEWAATRYALAVARQNGKGVILEVVTLAKTVLLRERVLWTAHEVRTMQEAFTRFRSIIEGTEAISRMVKNIRSANGQERIMFTNGAEVKFSARSKSAARGLGFRTIICDEAQELEFLTLGAMMPTLSGQGDARTQLILTGTPPYSRKGEVFSDTRATAYAESDERLAWSEWAAEPTDRVDDREVWAKTNPSLGVVIREEKIVDEFSALQARPDVFRRERLGEWGRSGDIALALDEGQWADGSVSVWPLRDLAYGSLRVLAVDCTFNAEMTTIVEAVPLEDGRVGLQIVEAAPGIEWVGEKIAELREQTPRVVVAFDPIRTGDLSADLREARVHEKNTIAASSRGLTLACDALVRTVREGRLAHSDPRLDAAAAGATRSTFDDGKGWKLVGTDGADVSPLIAGGLAVSALRDQRRRRTQSERHAIVL